MSHCVIYKEKGFVLIFVLFFMQIFAMLSVAMLSQYTFSLKMSQNYQQKHVVFQNAEKILSNLSHAINFKESPCEIPVIDSSSIVKKSIEWWSTVGCPVIEAPLKYYYVYEVLEENIFRITILAMDFHNNAKEILQNTIVKMDNAIQQKLWREL